LGTPTAKAPGLPWCIVTNFCFEQPAKSYILTYRPFCDFIPLTQQLAAAIVIATKDTPFLIKDELRGFGQEVALKIACACSGIPNP
jgi:hypothetical protein